MHQLAGHFECATGNVKHVQALVDVAKRRDLVSLFWGGEFKLSNVIVKQKKAKRRGGNPVEDTGH